MEQFIPTKEGIGRNKDESKFNALAGDKKLNAESEDALKTSKRNSNMSLD
jgi:hypothetical protein